MYKHILFICFLTFLSTCNAKFKDINQSIPYHPKLTFQPCPDVVFVEVFYETDLPPEQENSYELSIQTYLAQFQRLTLKFDSEATISLRNKSLARIESDNESFVINFFKGGENLTMEVKGPTIGTVPYLTSLLLNDSELCRNAQIGFLDNYLQGYKETAHVGSFVKQRGCGRRQVDHTELIFNGQPTKPGDWPWHAAVYRLEYTSARYLCGGTLISKNFVVTAAHCVTINGVPVLPEIVSVILGKYNLIGGDIATQERLVHQVMVHEGYFQKRLDNDIALLKMKTEAIYDEYVQPACLWNIGAIKRIPPGIVYGTVVGWGLNHNLQLSSQIHQASLPKIGDQTCLKSNPNFFGRVLNERKFCAGYTNGTSACNGDSGSGFMVFVPDIAEDSSPSATGAWYLNGIVSLAVKRPDAPVCDTSQYTLFTNVAVFTGWIDERIRTL